MLVVGLLSCRSSLSTYIWPAHQKGTPSTHIWSCSKLQSHQKGPVLTFTSMIGHTYYHLWNGSTLIITSMVGHTYYHLWNSSALISDLLVKKAQSHPGWNHIRSQWWETLTHNEERFMHLHLTWKELNPLAMNRMALPLHLTFSSEWLSQNVPGNWPGTF